MGPKRPTQTPSRGRRVGGRDRTEHWRPSGHISTTRCDDPPGNVSCRGPDPARARRRELAKTRCCVSGVSRWRRVGRRRSSRALRKRGATVRDEPGRGARDASAQRRTTASGVLTSIVVAGSSVTGRELLEQRGQRLGLAVGLLGGRPSARRVPSVRVSVMSSGGARGRDRRDLLRAGRRGSASTAASAAMVAGSPGPGSAHVERHDARPAARR